jgi:pimeloyl-ACP methyl ester carboxylesterase
MAELRKIETSPGLVFDAFVDGPDEGPLVLLLHGFAESFHMWRAQIAALAAAGFRAVAPSQRGYSPDARPNLAEAANYSMDCLVGDAMDIVARCGHGARRFHLVGHDWGGSIAWDIANRTPQRLASLTILSRPHPNAFNRALQSTDAAQAQRSQHHTAFLEPGAGPRLLADNARWLRERHAKAGTPAEAVERHLTVIGTPQGMEGALAWYRARGAVRPPIGMIAVPVHYLWGDADDSVGRAAAEGTREFVSGPYRFEEFPGGGHFLAEEAPEWVNKHLLAHLAEHPV